jgi:hypothetical protein
MVLDKPSREKDDGTIWSKYDIVNYGVFIAGIQYVNCIK